MAFPISVASPVRFPGPLPKAADVVVIGGGVIGVMTAWYLARRGVRVVLCEKGRIAGEQSSRNWGWVRQQGRDPAELPIMIEALSIWKGLEAEAGASLGFRQTGVLYIANGARDMAAHEAWTAHARAHGIDTRVLSRSEVAAMLPGDAGWTGGIWTASDAQAEPWIAVPRLAEAAAARGVRIVENCAVRALDITAGRVAGVMTEMGRVAADRVVLAGGSWSALFARTHGLGLPQLSVRATVAATAPLPQIFAGAAADSRFALRRRQDGGYTLALRLTHDFYLGPDAFRHFRTYLPLIRKDIAGTRFKPAAPRHFPDAWRTPRRWTADEETPFERMRILAPAPDLPQVERMRDRFAAAFPGLGKPPIAAAWAGMIDTMPDVLPVIDHAAALPGLTIATGLSGHGFGIGPGIGRVTADLVDGRAPGHDLGPFRLARFGSGA
ncbi:NAD(P)/FAD-dependent oxidoreductase [Defluviimonas salinarum]|uniref:FAD-binding oxidoreductase n=1 Tax=Defluviimonas salinarum TaxID=2992147 RepID=A0ABT3IZU1_9RHOB|nr:FAD-binding oxidoreductase [Defluviimonas salinarum]